MDSRRRLVVSVILFAGVFLAGVVGFKIFGGRDWTFLDALYMTAITISTIGYGEVRDLSGNPQARLFAIIFIMLSLGTIAYAVSSITAFIVEGELKNLLGRRKMEKEIARLKDHYIVCGSDETAQTIVRELSLTGREFVLVEPSSEKIKQMADFVHQLGEESGRHFRLLYVEGQPEDDAVLLRAGLERARGLFLSLPTDEANLYVTITARGLNPKVRIVAKGIDLKSHPKMKKAGADSVISPTYIGGMRMASEMIRPAATTFLDMMLRDRDRGLRVDEVPVEESSALAGKTVEEARLEEKTSALLVAIKEAGTENYIFNPPLDRVIRPGEVLIFIGNPEARARLGELARPKNKSGA